MNHDKSILYFKKLGIDTYKESIIYLRHDSHMCLSEGFEAKICVKVSANGKSIFATINIITSDLLKAGEVSLSEYAQKLLDVKENDKITVSHARPVASLSFMRSKIYGNELSGDEIEKIISDIVLGYYSDIQISAFLTACAGKRLSENEILNLTKAMVKVSERIQWNEEIVVDKHCVGGIPGNRTSPIIVAIVSAFGLIMPKTSSRAITSPSGTADTMEVLAPVVVDVKKMKEIIAKEKGCIIWGGSVSLSPADDILIRIERVLDLDSEGQMVASILSKKSAAGSSHVLIELPIGKTAKVRDLEMANILKNNLEKISEYLGIKVRIIFTDGKQPIGNGIGPALEARDIIAVLQNERNAPQDLRNHALMIAGEILEFSPNVKKGEGIIIAAEILNSGLAWEKFQAICEAQGGIKKIPQAKYIHPYFATKAGKVSEIDNRRIALVAKLAGAPSDKTAGIDLHVKIGDEIKMNQILFVIHTNSSETLSYTLDYFNENLDLINII